MRVSLPAPSLLACLAAGAIAACSRPTPPAATAAPARPGPAVTAEEPAAASPTTAAVEAAAPTAGAAAYTKPTGPVASVNGRDIGPERFNAEMDKLIGHGARIPPDRLQRIARNILARLVEAELRDQAIREHGIELTDSEFDEAWREFTARFMDAEGRLDEQRMRSELQRSRQTLEQVKQQIRDQRLTRKLVEKLGKVEVSEADLRAFYDGNPSAWVEAASRDVRPIVIRVPQEASAEVAAKGEERAKQAYQALKKGGDFEQIARQFGDGDPPAPLHLVRGSSAPELEKAAFELKVGEVSPPVRTRWGWYVLRLIEKNEQRVRPYPEVREEIRRTLTARRSYLEERRILQELRRKAEVVEKLPY